MFMIVLISENTFNTFTRLNGTQNTHMLVTEHNDVFIENPHPVQCS